MKIIGFALLLTTVFAQDKVISENYAIEGMMCSMGCVTKVTKAMQDLDGFEAVHFDFDIERKVDYAIVTFDNEVLSRKEVVAAIHSVSEGAYQVKEVSEACCKDFCEHSNAEEKI